MKIILILVAYTFGILFATDRNNMFTDIDQCGISNVSISISGSSTQDLEQAMQTLLT